MPPPPPTRSRTRIPRAHAGPGVARRVVRAQRIGARVPRRVRGSHDGRPLPDGQPNSTAGYATAACGPAPRGDRGGAAGTQRGQQGGTAVRAERSAGVGLVELSQTWSKDNLATQVPGPAEGNGQSAVG